MVIVLLCQVNFLLHSKVVVSVLPMLARNFEYIERYNSKRPLSSLGYLTPNEVEDLFWARQHSSASWNFINQIVSTSLTVVQFPILPFSPNM